MFLLVCSISKIITVIKFNPRRSLRSFRLVNQWHKQVRFGQFRFAFIFLYDIMKRFLEPACCFLTAWWTLLVWEAIVYWGFKSIQLRISLYLTSGPWRLQWWFVCSSIASWLSGPGLDFFHHLLYFHENLITQQLLLSQLISIETWLGKLNWFSA